LFLDFYFLGWTGVIEQMSSLSAAVVYCFNFGWIRIDYVALPLMMMKGVSVYLAWIAVIMLDYCSDCTNCISHGNTLSKSMHRNVYALAKTSMHQQTALAKRLIIWNEGSILLSKSMQHR